MCVSVSVCVCVWLLPWFHLSVLPRRHKPLPSAPCYKFLFVLNKSRKTRVWINFRPEHWLLAKCEKMKLNKSIFLNFNFSTDLVIFCPNVDAISA